MDAGKELIGGIFQYGRLLEIPFYQRAYVWDTTQWSRFLDDMAYISRSKRPFFFGSIILKAEPLDKDDGQFVTDKKIVTDGQQRLTTLMIFMRVLALKTNNLGGFNMVFCLVDGAPKLLHGKYDHDDFLAVMQKTDLTPFPDEKDASQIIRAFNYFAKELEPEEYEWQAILQYSLFVNINLLENEDEQQVFDTINTPGVSLSTAELLKNYFFRKDNVEAFEKDWVAVFEKTEDQRNYWQQDIFVGRNRRPLIDLFFDSFFQIMVEDKQYNVKNEDKIAFRRVDRLAISIKEFIGTYCHGDKQEMIAKMAYYAESFASAIRPETVKVSIPPAYGIERMNVVMFGLQTTTMIPYVLYVERNVADPEERNRIYAILEAYIMRRIVCHVTTKNYNRLFTSLILNRVLSADSLREELLRGDNATDATTYIPGDNELHDNFKSATLVNLQTKGILYMLESRIHPEMSAVSLRGFDNYSLEHLMPKKWRNNWPHPATATEATKRDFELLTLGNLAIIPQTLNASIRDANWQTKLSGKGYKPGLKSCAAGLYTMEAVLDKAAWDENCIHERAEWLYEKAATIWHIDGTVDSYFAEPELFPEEEMKQESVSSQSDVGSSIAESKADRAASEHVIYQVKANEKGTIQEIRRKFWKYALQIIKETHGPNGPFSNVYTSKENWISGYFGIGGFRISCTARTDCAYLTMTLGTPDREKNKNAYAYLLERKTEIESKLGTKVKWWPHEKGKESYVGFYCPSSVSINDENTWETMAKFYAEWSKKFYDVIVPYLYEWNAGK